MNHPGTLPFRLRKSLGFRRHITCVLNRCLFLAVFLLLFTCASKGHTAKKNLPAKPVDLNTATVSVLEELPGIGPATAKAIIQFRLKSGPFRRVDDLLAIRGISESKFDKLRPYIAVYPPKRRP